MDPIIHWYQPRTLIYWNVRGLLTPEDLARSDARLCEFLDEARTNNVHILMDWRDASPDNVLVGQHYLKHYLTFADHPNMGTLMAFNAHKRERTANIVLFAFVADLEFRLVADAQEALTTIGIANPAVNMSRFDIPAQQG